MFSNGNFFILLILLKYMSFTKFLLAENSTNINYNYYNNYSAILNENITEETNTIESLTTLSVNLTNNKSLHMAILTSNKTKLDRKHSSSEIVRDNLTLDELFLSDYPNSFEDDFQPKVEPLVGQSKYNGNNKRGRQQDRLQQPPTGLPVFPERSDAVYFIVAVIGGAKSWGRTLARTLLDMGPPFGSSMGPPLRPLYVDLPANGRFSVKVLTSLCQQSDGIPLAGIIVIGDGQSARAVALSGNAMNVPVLWAKGGTANIHGIQREGQAMLQSMLQPSANEILQAIRALFLQAHWHSFFVLSDVGSTIVLASYEGRPIKEPPLVPTILPLPAGNGDVFRQLAQISRSTRGIILLLCDLVAARRIMSEAKRLNMDGGHFIWLWADTSSTTEFFDFHHTSVSMEEKIVEYPEAVRQFLPSNSPAETSTGDSLAKHSDEFAERRMDFDEANVARRKIDGKLPDKSRGRSNLKHEQHQQQQEEQLPRKSFRKEPNGRYIIGLNRNSEESNEVKAAKEKRNPYQDFDNEPSRGHSYEDIGDLPRLQKNGANSRNENFQSRLSSAKTKNYQSDELTNIDPDDYTAERFDSIANGSETETDYNKSGKPKRTSSYYGRNNSRVSHVLFHHFEDFPIGLLALRPVRMPVDRHFIRSTIRLFASTWSKVDQDVPTYDDEAVRNRYRSRGRNSYLADDERHDRRSISKTSQQSRRRKNTVLNNRNRKRRDANDHIETVNTIEQTDINSSAIRNFRKINNNDGYDNSKKNNNSSNLTIGKQSSDLNDKLLIKNSKNTNSSYNQNLSGLTNPVANNTNNGSNIMSSTKLLDSNLNLKKTKRYNTWWSAKDIRQHSPTVATSGPNGNFERYRKGSPHYKGGCYGMASKSDIKKAETFSKALKEATTLALSGQKLFDGSLEKPLTTNFELLNLVPDDTMPKVKTYADESAYSRLHHARRADFGETKWRHVGSISGTNVQLDTIVWPGGDIVVSGLSVQSRTIFRIVTALAPPFVMESEREEHGLCLRGLPCHRLLPTAQHNLTLMFNAIETRDRFEEDAMEHGIKSPPQDESSSYDHSMYLTKCCYGLSMDLLENIALELNFEFHLYVVHDELFGRRRNDFPDYLRTKDSEFRRKGQIFWNEKHEQLYHKDQSLNRRSQQAPLGGSNYYSASFERKSDLNTNSDLNEDSERLNGDAATNDNKGGKDEHGNIRQENFDTSRGSTSTARNTKNDIENKENRRRLYQTKRIAQWNGIVADLLAGSADMSFAPLSVTKTRAQAIDFSVPYFHSGVSLLAAPTTKSEIPLLAFLLPFSPELWIAIFTSLNVTAIAVAIYEWLSPFGLNPWGRQRSKNFSMSSALWVMWGLLCGHLVAFKAPKSWPNKFLINVWGGFSVIFIASYTANIAALIAGLFFHNASNRYDVSLLTQRVGAPTASAAETYVQKNDPHLWEHMKKYTLNSIEDGIQGLKNGTLDLVMADTPILDYYRATDHGCNLQRIGDTFVEDTYAIGMTKGFPLKDSISALIAKYSSNGYLDILTEKWYGGLPCFKLDNDIVQPRPLGVEAVTGVFLLLGLGMILGLLILIFEHLFYKYTLPILRHKPKGTVWKSRNIMFFSQKLYRFINCVELVSPHHAARELVHTLRQGQIASLFQKSIKREDEQRRRRRSKAQFFEMIQEIRRVQQQERNNPKLEVVTEIDGVDGTEVPHKPKSSPIPRLFSNRKDSRSRSNSSTLNVRRFSTDSILSERMDTIGRRLSRDLTNSPPDFGRRFDTFGKNNSNKFDTFSGGKNLSSEKIEETKFDTYSGKDVEKPPLPVKKYHNRRTPLNSETFHDKSREDLKIRPLPVLKEGLVHPICQEDSTKAVLRDRLHEELRSKYGDDRHPTNAQHYKGQMIDRAENQHHRQRSLDGIESRPPMPSPRHSYNGFNSLEPPALPPKVSPRSNLTHVSLDRLSREDLLKLSESSQSEIHDYLNKSKTGRPSEPP